MIICPICGLDYYDGKYCKNCGYKNETKNHVVDVRIDSDWRYYG
jgi:hypothetical protein